jgi:transketolase
VTDLDQLSDQIRRTVLEEARRANIGHIGSCLSIADIMAALYGGVLDPVSPDDPERDRFVLSKGHAALSLYAALHAAGVLSSEDLHSYCTDGSWVGGHPEHELAGVEFSTGSLGHGLSMSAGSALAGRIGGSSWRVFTLLSDAECNEGSTWEAAMFAAHHQLSRLVAIVDANGQQALGYTRDVLDMEPLEERWRSFGWDVHEVDGHDPQQISDTIAGLDFEQGAPHMLIARTTFGKGVDFMESQIQWHYLPMSEEQFEAAMAQVGGPAQGGENGSGDGGR